VLPVDFFTTIRKADYSMKYHEKTPKKLRQLLRKHKGNQNAAAKEIGVNSSHISKLVNAGIEPKDKHIRARMFLPIHPVCETCGRKIIHRTKSVSIERPYFAKLFDKLPAEEKNRVKKEYIDWKTKHG